MKRHQTPEWIATEATIVSCRQTFISSLRSLPIEGVTDSPEFIVIFSYKCEEQTFEGKYRPGSPQPIGHCFEIRYNPANPKENTATNYIQTRQGKIVIWALGACLGVILIWLSEKYGWQ